MNASYFDGLTSRRHAVTLNFVDRRWVVSGDSVQRSEHVDSVRISSAHGLTPRFVTFADGAVCEVDDAAGLAEMLATGSVADDRIGGTIVNTKLIAVILVGFIALLFVTYRYGVPAAANQVADRAPDVAIRKLGGTTLNALDTMAFKPSEITHERRSGLISAFADVQRRADAGASSTLLFRKSEAIGANAMTLPDGTIVITDELIALAKSDDEIFGVIAHEAGHAKHRHALRMMLESSAISALLSWYVGDVNTLAVTAPASLLNAKYSRDFEREADEYAIAVMKANGIDPSVLGDILDRMSEKSGGSGVKNGGPSVPAYLSTHPTNDERRARFRR